MHTLRVVRAALFGAAALLPAIANAEHWAVIVAGSQGYWNYRHQADACHAYHVVRRHGIPEENVILMMYDDAASSEANPFPGKLYNMPANPLTHAEPMEVYEGCKVDYRGEDVTPEMFMNVLMGNTNATKGNKVLGSTGNDRVFVNFVDHGGDGVIIFPEGQLLTANQLTSTLQHMHAANKYKELVFYVEACESGSMFHDADMSKINAYVTTAANATESSWGVYCPPMDVVNGKAMSTCLGDLYSINWMQDSDRTDLSAESLQKQYKIVKKLTNLSNVEEFGSPNVRREIVGNFQSNYDNDPSDDSGSDDEDDEPESDESTIVQSQSSSPESGAVNAHDISLVLAFYRYLRSERGHQREQFAEDLVREIESRERADRLFERISKRHDQLRIQAHAEPINSDRARACHDQMFDSFKEQCGSNDQSSDLGHGFSSYSVQYARVLGDLCRTLGDISLVEAVLRDSCAVPADVDDSGMVYDPAVYALA